MHKCMKCGTEFAGKFCPECGTQWQEQKACPQCGVMLSGGAKFCNECGYSFLPPKKSETVKKKLFAVLAWVKKHLNLVVPSAIGLVFVIVMLSLIPTFILASVNGTYYGYLNGEFSENEYITLSTGKWKESSGASGKYEVKGKQITLIYRDKDMGEIFGDDSELAVQKLAGTVSNKVLAVKNGSGTVVYVRKDHKHKFGKAETVIEPTCTAGGTAVRKCACGLQEIIELATISHTIVEGFCSACKQSQLKFELNADESGYVVAGFAEDFENSQSVEISAVYNNLPVTNIGDSAFENCNGLTSIVIPDSVTSIGDGAFSYCSGLTSVVIPDSVTYIGDVAFYRCSSLTKIIIPESVINVGFAAFYRCSSLAKIIIPDSVIDVGVAAFYDTAYYNNEINWLNNALYIGNHLIRVKFNISDEYQIKESTKTIASYAFCNFDEVADFSSNGAISCSFDEVRACSNLASLVIPDSVTNIGASAFFGCSGLTSVALGNGVTSIGNNAFVGCSGLTSIAIPNSVTSIGASAFFGCDGLTIYCEAESKPDGWESGWNLDTSYREIPVVWGYRGEE